MDFLKRLSFLGLVLFSFSAAKADQVCAGYDGNGNCIYWIDTNTGGGTPNIPGVPGNPSNPGTTCVCAGYNAQNQCIYYINCSQSELNLSSAREQVCLAQNPDGSCSYWWDPGTNDLKPNNPTVPGNPGNPGGTCDCVAYNSSGQCIKYINCAE